MVLPLYGVVDGGLPAYILKPVSLLKLALSLIQGEKLHFFDSSNEIRTSYVLGLRVAIFIFLFLAPTATVTTTTLHLQLFFVAYLTQNTLFSLSFCMLNHLSEHFIF